MSFINENREIFLSLQSGVLGALIGGIFAICRLKPPSPDNLSGILGIVGIYVGWILIGQIIK